jgi:hypothetical protein
VANAKTANVALVFDENANLELDACSIQGDIAVKFEL